MQIICISRGTLKGGKQLAERLAEKMGYRCLSREELVEAATKEGIHVGKLEMAMVRPGIFSERLALERDHYLAFSTAYLCEKAMEGGLVYHGRTGHLLLSGVSHVLRARVVADEEYRIRAVMQSLGLDREKARRYIEGVDEDRRRWIHSMYGVSWEDASNYDITLNLSQMSADNAAVALVNFAQLPEFQMTPASQKALEDLCVGATVRKKIAQDERTHEAKVKVRADGGVVMVSYLPQQAKFAELFPEVCRDIPGVREIRPVMAMTNLLWVQERFDPHSDTYKQVVDIATKWNAAVELVRFVSDEDSEPAAEGSVSESAEEAAAGPGANKYNGGIEEDAPDVPEEDGGLRQTLDELAKVGKSAGGRTIRGDGRRFLGALDRTISYTLVVIGDVYLSKGHAARLRAARDLRSFLDDRINAPVVTADELETQYLFGKRDIIRIVPLFVLTLLLYYLVFTHQDFVLSFLAFSGWYAEAIKGTFLAEVHWLPKIIVSVAVFILVPIVAYSYGTVTKTMLKLIKME